MASPDRRAIDLVRRGADRVQRVRDRADALVHTWRVSKMSLPQGVLSLQDSVHDQLADGTLVMGRESYFAPTVDELGGGDSRVVVGNFASVAHDAICYLGGRHRSDWVAQFPLRERLRLPGAGEDGHTYGRGDIHLGHDTWITRGTVVMSGVTIGPGAVVATRSVVTRDVAPYAIVGGIPAREIGKRFDDEQIAALLRIAWWDWPVETIKERVGALCDADVDAFIARHDPGPP